VKLTLKFLCQLIGWGRKEYLWNRVCNLLIWRSYIKSKRNTTNYLCWFVNVRKDRSPRVETKASSQACAIITRTVQDRSLSRKGQQIAKSGLSNLRHCSSRRTLWKITGVPVAGVRRDCVPRGKREARRRVRERNKEPRVTSRFGRAAG